MSYSHVRSMQNASSIYMVFLTWCLFPLATLLAISGSFYGYAHGIIYQIAAPKSRCRKVLITGSSPASIALARTLQAAGNDVIGADYLRFPFLSSARFSGAFHSFHDLYKQGKWQPPKKKIVIEGLGVRIEITVPFQRAWQSRPDFGFGQDVIALIEHEKPDLWIPCLSSHNHFAATDIIKATEAVQRRALCRVLHADEDTAEMLTDDSAFGEYVEQLEMGVRVPEFKTVTSRDEVHRILAACPDESWELEHIPEVPTSGSETAKEDEDNAYDDEKSKRRWTWPVPPKYRSDVADQRNAAFTKRSQSLEKMKVPLRTKNATYHSIAGMTISSDHPWTMREVISGQSITLHLLVVRNRLRAMEASLAREREILDFQTAELIPSTSLLHKPLALFAETFTASLPEDTSSFLTISVVVSGTATTMGVINTIFPISCSVGAHPAAPALMAGGPEQAEKFVRAVMDYASPIRKFSKRKDMEGDSKALVPLALSSAKAAMSAPPRGVYSFYPALLNLVVVPFFTIFTSLGSSRSFLESLLTFFEKCFLFQDDLLSLKDPWPFWWEWHIRMPLLLFAAMVSS